MLVVFDIDGTLANIEHRRDYVRKSTSSNTKWDECAKWMGM